MSSENTTVEKVYTYEMISKNGKSVTKKVVRKYTNKKDTTNTLQNKSNKEFLEKSIQEKFDEIKALPERKQIRFIKENCLPENVTASYNTIKTIWRKAIEERRGDSGHPEPEAPNNHEGSHEEVPEETSD